MDPEIPFISITTKATVQGINKINYIYYHYLISEVQKFPIRSFDLNQFFYEFILCSGARWEQTDPYVCNEDYPFSDEEADYESGL